MLVLLALLFTSPALAEDCDAKALATALDEASPASIGKHFAALAACDERAAKRRTDAAFARMIENDGARDAVVAALAMGGGEASKKFLSLIHI